MTRRATIIDIARAAGVSKSTVSLVLTGGGKIKPATERAVKGAMRELGYVYNRGAASLRNPQTRIVGMVINDLSNPFFAELAIGIERVLRISGYIPFMANTAESLVRQAEVVRSMREHGASGIILCPTMDSEGDEVAALATLGIPLVLAIRRIPGAKVSLVASDNHDGAEQAREGLVPGRDMAVIGFDDTAEARQMSPALTTVSVGAGDLGERAGQMLLRQIEGTASGPETYVGEARLVVRESCGRPVNIREVA